MPAYLPLVLLTYIDPRTNMPASKLEAYYDFPGNAKITCITSLSCYRSGRGGSSCNHG